MKSKYKLVLFVFLYFFVSYNLALAVDLNWTNDTQVTINSNNYLIRSTSAATSIIVGATTLTITVPTGSSVEILSNDRYILNNDQNITKNCSDFSSSLNISGPITVVITPDGNNTCSPGYSGVGSSAPTPTPTPTPSASSAAHPNGTLVISNGTVYLIKNGTRIGFRNEAEYQSHGYNFAQVVNATEGDLALPLSSAVEKSLEGTLVIDSSDGVTVYMIGQNGTKRGFASAAVFTALGYNFANLPMVNLTDYPAADPINDASLPHPEGALTLDSNGTVWWILDGVRQGFESEAVFNTYGFNWGKIVPANSADLALDEGPLVKFRDGTLVYDGGNYYIVSGGQKLMFSSTADMIARGYSQSNAISASLSNYPAGGTVE